MPGHQLAHVPEDRQRPRDRVEREEGLERVEVDLAARQRAQLGGELEPARDDAVEQRLDPEAIAGEDEAAASGIPDRDREHAAQALRESRPVLLVEMDEHLGVAVGAEAVALRLQLGAELPVVVELAVLDDDDAAVLVRDRLVAGLEVDDRQPAGGETDGAVDVDAARVGPAVDERRAHRLEPAPVRPRGRHDSADPTHAAESRCRARRVPAPTGARRARQSR